MKPKIYAATDLKPTGLKVEKRALDICRTLQSHGFDGYLVGGCVRDWLLDHEPKDFDVVTNAKPEQIRPLFRHARIIGRRFRLVHVTHYRDYIEVATYRATPKAESRSQKPTTSHSGRVLNDNTYGTIVDDVNRRDFTANALYYDPIKEQVIDYIGGVEAIQRNVLELIGNPKKRFREDPVRILRALRFQAKLGLEFDTSYDAQLTEYGHLLLDVSNARQFDEVFKLFHYQFGEEVWYLLREYELTGFIFPQALEVINRLPEMRSEEFIINALVNTDKRVGQGKPVIPAYFFAVLLWHPLQQELSKPMYSSDRDSLYAASNVIFGRQASTVLVPKRVQSTIIEIWDFQWALEKLRPKAILRLLSERRFRAAYDFLALRAEIDEVDDELVTWWTDIQEESSDVQLARIDQLRHQQTRNKATKTRRRRKSKPKTS